MVFANGLPVQAMPGNLLGKHEHAPLPIDCRVKQGFWRYAIPLHPPGIDLSQSNVIRLSRCLGLPDNLHGFFPGGRAVILSGYIDDKRISAGFLYGDCLQQGMRGVFGPRWQGRESQHKQQRNDFFHVFRLVFLR
jgi:hypothetical protein